MKLMEMFILVLRNLKDMENLCGQNLEDLTGWS